LTNLFAIEASKVAMETSFRSPRFSAPKAKVSHEINKNAAVGMNTLVTNQPYFLLIKIVTNTVEYTLPVDEAVGSVSNVFAQ
jgi:hypothetical protein